MASQITPIYRGTIIEVNIENVQLPDGRQFDLEIVRHPGGAATVALDEENQVCLLRQYRHAADGWLWELPAGKLDPDEGALQTAQRELHEEAGLRARTWDPLGSMISSPGVFTEVIHLFLARDLSKVPTCTEDHECIEVFWQPLSTAMFWASNGKIVDAKTLIGLFRAAALVERESNRAVRMR